jgi:hypothetical protein
MAKDMNLGCNNTVNFNMGKNNSPNTKKITLKGLKMTSIDFLKITLKTHSKSLLLLDN